MTAIGFFLLVLSFAIKVLFPPNVGQILRGEPDSTATNIAVGSFIVGFVLTLAGVVVFLWRVMP